MINRSVSVDLFGNCREEWCCRPLVGDCDFYVVVERTVAASIRTLDNISNKKSAWHRFVDKFREWLRAVLKAGLSGSM